MRMFLILSLALVCSPGWPQTSRWKLFLETSGTWQTRRGVEIDSTGLVVTHENMLGEMPRCGRVTGILLQWLHDSVAQSREVANQAAERSWPGRLEDGGNVVMTIIWPDDDERVTFRFGAASDPPAAVRVLSERARRVWKDAKARCVPVNSL